MAARLPTPGAILFDLDCTLTDRRASIECFASRFISRFGSGMIGDSRSLLNAMLLADENGYAPRSNFIQSLRQAELWKNIPRSGAIEVLWRDEFPACTRPAPLLLSTLKQLLERRIKLGLVSNGSAGMQRRKIEALRISPYLSTIAISAEVGLRKPDVRIFRLALEAMGMTPSQSWFVGDHPVYDMAGAHAAGLTAIQICAMDHPARDGCLQIREISELLDLME
ncbi:MAG TPA: HAD family hydrolase [Tepidisphaeraceae bacterium]|nr:HAD family hydrolase [Tepidisphaeraceae bacterium]